MISVTYNDVTYSCTTAIKGTDYVHLLDSDDRMIVAFDGVSSFTGFTISGGSWTIAADTNSCNIAVIGEDGAVRKSSYNCQTIGIKPRLAVTVVSGSVVTVTNGTVSMQQTSSGSVLNFDVSGYGTWSVSATKDGDTSNVLNVVVDDVCIYELYLTFFKSRITVTIDSGATVTCSKQGTPTQTATSTGSVQFTVPETGTYTITATKDGYSAQDTVEITADNQSKSVVLQFSHIYGVIWDGTATSAFSRTDEAVNFTDPVPYILNASSYSSPFDTLQPWAGMQRVTDANAGELVSIPKYWYKWTVSGDSLKLQIASNAVPGYHVSPAHADRGDGSGERDIVYVGRYHCGSNYKSATNTTPVTGMTRSTARSSIHGLGTKIWQYDHAMFWTIAMLYLVEFADWNSQAKIGTGCGNNTGIPRTGDSDNMPYHTGTMKSQRSTAGIGCQYRYIEGLWDNVYNWIDGMNWETNSGTSTIDMYVTKNPSNFADNISAGTFIGQYLRIDGIQYISKFSLSAASGFEYALYPTAANGDSGNTYICDCYRLKNADNNYYPFYAGGEYNPSYPTASQQGLFYLASTYQSSSVIGCRLQKLP